MTIIGIDYSKNIKKCGLSIGRIGNSKITFDYVGLYKDEKIQKVFDDDGIKLIAIDAPLGWPIELSRNLINHSAGENISIESNSLFRRKTDKVVKDITNKQSLDVGADKIARTAHGALNLIEKIRNYSNSRIPMSWQYDNIDESSVIEVYPAVTLKQNGLRFDKYKNKDNISNRREMVNRLQKICILNNLQRDEAIDDDNVLDSIVCVLAGYDYIMGKCVEPNDLNLAKKESWIWFRHKPNHI